MLTTQLSVADGGVHVTVVPQVPTAASAFTVIVAGQPVIVGFVTSVTTTLNEHVAVLPPASVAVYVTGVDPTGKKSPGDLVLVNVSPAVQLSEATGAVQVTFAPQTPAGASALMLTVPGHPVMVGLVASLTTTLNVQVAVLPATSVAV